MDCNASNEIILLQFACGIFNFDEITKRAEVNEHTGLLALKQQKQGGGRTVNLHWKATGQCQTNKPADKLVIIKKDQCLIHRLKDNPKVFFIESDGQKHFYWIQ